MLGNIWYTEGHPSGYTDDLGIIADRNQWVSAELPGWYVGLSRDTELNDEVIEWCRENLKGFFYPQVNRIHITRYEDIVLLKLRWY